MIWKVIIFLMFQLVMASAMVLFILRPLDVVKQPTEMELIDEALQKVRYSISNEMKSMIMYAYSREDGAYRRYRVNVEQMARDEADLFVNYIEREEMSGDGETLAADRFWDVIKQEWTSVPTAPIWNHETDGRVLFNQYNFLYVEMSSEYLNLKYEITADGKLRAKTLYDIFPEKAEMGDRLPFTFQRFIKNRFDKIIQSQQEPSETVTRYFFRFHTSGWELDLCQAGEYFNSKSLSCEAAPSLLKLPSPLASSDVITSHTAPPIIRDGERRVINNATTTTRDSATGSNTDLGPLNLNDVVEYEYLDSLGDVHTLRYHRNSGIVRLPRLQNVYKAVNNHMYLNTKTSQVFIRVDEPLDSDPETIVPDIIDPKRYFDSNGEEHFYKRRFIYTKGHVKFIVREHENLCRMFNRLKLLGKLTVLKSPAFMVRLTIFEKSRFNYIQGELNQATKRLLETNLAEINYFLSIGSVLLSYVGLETKNVDGTLALLSKRVEHPIHDEDFDDHDFTFTSLMREVEKHRSSLSSDVYIKEFLSLGGLYQLKDLSRASLLSRTKRV